MRLVQAAFAVLFLGVPVGACTTTNQNDCQKDPMLRCQGSGGTGGSMTIPFGPPRCDDKVKNGAETGVDCGGTECAACDGDPCSEGTECKSEFCADGVCCDEACGGLCEACNRQELEGTCSPLPVGENDPDDQACADLGGCGEMLGYCRFNDGVKSEGEADVDCGGISGKECGVGATCTVASDCASTYCADGRCCNSGCTLSECVTCNAEDHPGLCLPVAYGTKDNQCSTTEVCNGGGQCSMANDNNVAQQPCTSDSQCASNNCVEMTGHCKGCAIDDDCDLNRTCLDGACIHKAADGSACTADAGCQHGHCVDGVCCNVECTGPCMGCHNAYTTNLNSGSCSPIRAGLDPHDECTGPGDAATCNGSGACGTP